MANLYCKQCFTRKHSKNFAKNIFTESGYDYICKDCRNKIKNIKQFMEYLQENNRPWDKDLYDKVAQIKREDGIRRGYSEDKIFQNIINTYISKTAIIKQKPTVKEEDIKQITKGRGLKSKKDIVIKEESDEQEIPIELKKEWLGNYTLEEYEFLQNFFEDLISVYACDTPIQKNLYKNIAITQLEANKARQTGKIDEYQKLMNTISKLMNDANIKPVQSTGEIDGGLSTWGEWIKKIEEEEPIPEASNEFKDVDGIKKYIDKWFVGHFARIFGITNDFEIKREELDGDEE